MKKIINDPSNVVSEMVDGLVRAYPQYLTQIDGTEAVVRTNKDSMKGKVGLVSGGGSGHEPAHAGYVGQGMLSAAVCGQVFTSPTPDQIYEAIKAVDQGQGVFCIVKNYSGDVMNFDMAKDLAEADGIDVKSVVVDDDIAELQVETFATGICGNEDACAITEVLESKVPVVNAHGAVQRGYCIALRCQQSLQIALSCNEFCEDDDLLIRVSTQYLVNGIEERLDLDVRMLELCLTCDGNDLFELRDLFVCIE